MNNYWLTLLSPYISIVDGMISINESGEEEDRYDFITISFHGGESLKLALRSKIPEKFELNETGFSNVAELLEDGQTITWDEFFEKTTMIVKKDHGTGKLTYHDFDEWGKRKHLARLDNICHIKLERWSSTYKGISP